MPQAEEEEVSYLQRSHHILQLFPHKMQISASGWFENPHLKNKKEIKPRNQQVLALSFMFFYYIFSFPSPFSFFFAGASRKEEIKTALCFLFCVCSK